MQTRGPAQADDRMRRLNVVKPDSDFLLYCHLTPVPDNAYLRIRVSDYSTGPDSGPMVKGSGRFVR